LTAKAKVHESILALKPDVLALQEIGSLAVLQGLRSALKSEGLEFPYWELVAGSDTNVHVAILSKFPFAASRARTNDNFLLVGADLKSAAVLARWTFKSFPVTLYSHRGTPQIQTANSASR